MAEHTRTSQPLASTDVAPDVNDDKFTIDPVLRLSLLILIIVIALKGVISNTINIVVFFQLRKSDPININLLGLAVSDLIICLTTLVFFAGTSNYLKDLLISELKIDPLPVLYMTVGISHADAVRITVSLTAFIASERCLCVVNPLHVKSIITHRRVWVSVGFCYFMGVIDLLSFWYTTRLAWQYDPNLNMTILSHVMMENFYSVNVILSPLRLIIFFLLPFTIVVVTTGMLMRHLKRHIQFRQSAGITDRGISSVGSGHAKETKVVKMVLIICLLFIICYIPNTAFVMITTFTSDINLSNAEKDELQIVFYFGFLFDTINSSINIWIYYFHSSKYKRIFNKMFNRNTKL